MSELVEISAFTRASDGRTSAAFSLIVCLFEDNHFVRLMTTKIVPFVIRTIVDLCILCGICWIDEVCRREVFCLVNS